MSEGYRTPAVCRLVGLSFRRLDYWDRIGLLQPSVSAATGSGSLRLYSEDDVLMALAIGALLKDGLTLGYIHWQLSTHLREAIQAGEAEYRWGAGPVRHALDLASLRERLHRLVAA